MRIGLAVPVIASCVGALLLPEGSTRPNAEHVQPVECSITIILNGAQCGHGSIEAGGGFGGANHGASACYKCYLGGDEIAPWHCHSCGFQQEGEEGVEEEEAAYALLLAAGEAGDVEKVVELARRVPSRVVLNEERESVQIKSCDGKRLIGNVPLTVGQFADLGQALRTNGRLAEFAQ